MSCSLTRAALPALAHDLLATGEADAALRHLAGCADCAAERARVERAFAGLAAELATSPAPPAAVWEAVAPAARERVEPDPALGRVGDYALVRALQGELGPVYEGRHAALGGRVVLETTVTLPAGPARERYASEAAALARLDHPNLVAVHAWVDEEGRAQRACELAEGEQLEAVLGRRGRVPPGECLPWAIDACRGLEHAHQRGHVHRDLRPSTLLITPSGVARIVDFGALHLAPSTRTCGSGMTLGLIHHMSREQLLGKPFDARTDVYGLGVVLYQCLTGRLPFENEEERRLAVDIVKGRAAPPSRHWPEIPPALEAIVLKAIALEPEQRFQSALEFEQALLRFLERGEGPEASPPSRATPARAAGRAAPPAAPSRLPWLAGAAGVALLAAAALPLVLFGSGARRVFGAVLLAALGGVAAFLLLLLGVTRADLRGPRACAACGRVHRPGDGCCDR